MKIMILYIFLIFVAIITLFVIIALRNVGRVNNGDYSKLYYYKNGKFVSPKSLPHTFKRDKVSNEKFSFLKLFFKSKNAPKDKLPTVKPTFAEVPSDFAIFWLGHSNAILELDEKRIIIDPVFDNAAPIPFVVSRYVDSLIKRENLPHIDYVVITHNHYDHLERKTVQKLKNSKFVVPLGVGDTLIG